MQKFRMNVDAVWTLHFQYTNRSLKPSRPLFKLGSYSRLLFFFFFFFSLRNLDQFLNFTLQENQMAERHARVPKHWRSWPNFWLSLSDQPHQMFILAKGRPNLCRLQNIERAFHFRQPNALKNGNSTWLFCAMLRLGRYWLCAVEKNKAVINPLLQRTRKVSQEMVTGREQYYIDTLIDQQYRSLSGNIGWWVHHIHIILSETKITLLYC